MTFNARETELIEATKRYVADYVAPNAAAWNRARELPREAFRRAAAIGLTGIEVPESMGGAGCSFSTKARIAEELATADFGVAMALINTQNVAKKLAGYPEVPASGRHIPGLLSAERIGCTALTEPGAGSDFAAIVTRAKRCDGGWVLNGEKAWITNAVHADSIVTYVQTKTIGDMSGIAAIIVDGRRDGFVRGEHCDAVGLFTAGSGSFRLVNYVASEEEMIGAPGAAFKAIMHEINGARIYIAAMCCGMLLAAVHAVSIYGTQRHSFGRALADHQGWRWTLAEAASEIAAAKAFVTTAASRLDANEDVQLIAAQTKIFATRAVERHLPALAHLMGAEGLTQSHLLARHLVGARFAGLVDGSTEMLLERVAKLIRPK